MNEMTPDTKTRRKMLTERIANYKQNGFSAFMELEAAKVQNPGPSKEAKAQHREMVADLEAQMNNAYAAAKRLQAIKDAMDDEVDEPESEPEPDKEGEASV